LNLAAEETRELEFDEYLVRVTRKRVRRLSVSVRPCGEVRVSAPRRTPWYRISEFIRENHGWIQKQRCYFESLPVAPVKHYVQGEVHQVQGEPYVLMVRRGGRTRVDVCSDSRNLKVTVQKNASVETALDKWYRSLLKREIAVLVSRYEPVMGVKVSSVGIRRMKTRWGSCNIRAGRIWINLVLAQCHPGCLESIVVHEMTHLIEPGHNKRFYGLMDRFYPEWRSFEETLKAMEHQL
jgi:predicted metal-dependent hydrolase